MSVGRLSAIAIVVLACIAVSVIAFVSIPTREPEPTLNATESALGEFSPLSPPRPAPETPFSARNGKSIRFADFRGHWLLVNLWATWCAPCVKEMPSLDRMQARFGPMLDVIAVSEDRNGAAQVTPFIAKFGILSLTIDLDPEGALSSALEIKGLPTSYLVDPHGQIVARLEGAADWDAPRTLNTLRRLMGADSG